MLAFDQGDPAAALDLLEPFDGGDQGHGDAGQAPMTSSRRRDTVATSRPPFGAEPPPECHHIEDAHTAQSPVERPADKPDGRSDDRRRR